MPEMTNSLHILPYPSRWHTADRDAFASLARSFQNPDSSIQNRAREQCLSHNVTSLTAAAHILLDLASQGWTVTVDEQDRISVAPPLGNIDPVQEKERVRQQELLKRNEQLSIPSVRRFVTSMEKPREFGGTFVSIFNLMRDGAELADALKRVSNGPDADPSLLRTVIDPYVEVVSEGRCAHTGLRLIDIWRYFRHTWSNQYTSTPGRTMMILIRDKAAPFHPIIGIAALGSAVMQLSERDNWIGWQPSVFIEELHRNPTLRAARWITQRLRTSLEGIYLDDLIRDNLYWPSLWENPTADAIERLAKEAEIQRHDHHRFVNRAEFKKTRDAEDIAYWQQRAESHLFRSKRCLALSDLLSARYALAPYLYPKPTRAGLVKALDDPKARRAITSVIRRAKADSVGTEIADLTVCGAVAPYNALLGGKLVSMLAVSPHVVRAYHDRYAGYAGEIASAMAGRPIRRRSNLVFVGTTSLYGSGASQYNRIRIPADILGGSEAIEYKQLGKSKSFGTSHLSHKSVQSLVRLTEETAYGARVNSIFGEGVNPKLRKVRHGMDLLGWPSDILLQHGRQRIIYGINLVDNLLPYLLGIDTKPLYKYRRRAGEMRDVHTISKWWMNRWLSSRITSPGVLNAVAQHNSTRPVRHGARVPLPPLPDMPTDAEQLALY